MNEQTIITALEAPIKLEGFGSADISEKAQRRIDRLKRRIESRDAEYDRDQATIFDLQNKLASAQLNEAAALARLNDGSTWAKRWEHEAAQQRRDYEALEGQLNDMRSRFVEARTEIARLRSRSLWQRIINR